MLVNKKNYITFADKFAERRKIVNCKSSNSKLKLCIGHLN